MFSLKNTFKRDGVELPKEVSKYWEKVVWDRYIEELKYSSKINNELVAERLRTIDFIKTLDNKLSILDLCCGTGKIANDIIALHCEHDLVCVDINPRALNLVRFHSNGKCPQLILADVENLSLPKKFDVVLCIDSLHHLSNPKLVIRKIKEWLINGGWFIGNVLAKETYHQWEIMKYGLIRHNMFNIRYYIYKILYQYTKDKKIKEKIAFKGIVRLRPYKKEELIELIKDEFDIKEIETSFYHWFVCRNNS